MKRQVLNGTDLEVTRVCLGTMTFGAQADPSVACRILSIALEAGINFIDTANVYARGGSERLLGELLGARRHEVVLASKIGMKVGDEIPGLRRDAIVSAVESSLGRLRTDRLDICYLHQPDYSTPVEESLAAMDSLVQSGKVRYVGTSNFAGWQVTRMMWVAAQRGFAPPLVAQPMYNLLARRVEDEFLPACRDLGISTVAYNPLAGGLLTAKHNNGPLPGTRFDANQAYLDRYWNPSNLEAVARLSGAAREAGRTLTDVALNWLLCHSAIDCVVLGASKPDQLRDNLRAIERGPLDAGTLEACDRVWSALNGVAPKYNRLRKA
jgi:aryl-alcohol dehydrogenase-like predicted oxidoreductase